MSQDIINETLCERIEQLKAQVAEQAKSLAYYRTNEENNIKQIDRLQKGRLELLERIKELELLPSAEGEGA